MHSPATVRLALPTSAKRLILALILPCVFVVALFRFGVAGEAGTTVVPMVLVLVSILESTDSATGMGFGAGLSPLLFALGYEPLQIVPALPS